MRYILHTPDDKYPPSSTFRQSVFQNNELKFFLSVCSKILIIIISQKGNTLIKYKGYTFCGRKEGPWKKQNSNKYWNCSTHNYKGCHASLLTIDDIIIREKLDHNHPPPAHSRQPITRIKKLNM